MRIVVWVLAGIGAVVLLGGVVLPLVSWLLGVLGWIVAGTLVVGGGIYLARRLNRGGDGDPAGQLITDGQGRPLP